MVIPSCSDPVYLVPGLGADARLFEPLKAEGIDVRPLNFIPPQKGENLAGYAKRLSMQIQEDGPVNLGGVSLGGMIAGEMSRFLPVKRLLLISTVKHRKEMPVYLRLMGRVPLHRLVSGDFVKRYAPKDHGFGMTPEVRKVLDAMRNDADPEFVRWAIDAVVRWKQLEPPADPYHLHGTKDRLFTPKLISKADWIEGGGHGIVITHVPQVAAWIKRQLATGETTG